MELSESSISAENDSKRTLQYTPPMILSRIRRLPQLLPLLPLLAVLALYAVWLAYPITIITADIGRHIMDGRVFITYPNWQDALLHTNFYTSSNPDFPIVNHHWGAGIIFAMARASFGWKGLHLFAIALCLSSLFLILRVARNLSNNWIPCLVAFLLLPMIAYRHEVRPEFIAYVLLGITVWILHAVCREQASQRYLSVLPFVFLFWINIHASFPVGIALIGLFTVDAFLRKAPVRNMLLLTLLLSCAVLILNPAGFAGILYPFSILHDPGYAVLENQTIAFLSTVGVEHIAFTYLKVTSALLLIATAFLAYRKKLWSLWPYVGIAFLAVLMGFLAVRHITLAGLLLIPVFAATFREAMTLMKAKVALSIACVFVILGIVLQFSLLRNRWIVLGLEPGARDAELFMKEHDIKGPFFNNFDIGGYVTLYFFPEIRPFVYNRPESHPADFWRNTYIPMMQDDVVWRQKLAEYGFNAIILYHGDRTTWAQQFLTARIRDPEWAAVFVDRSVIVFVRRTLENSDLIGKFAIPPSALLQ